MNTERIVIAIILILVFFIVKPTKKQSGGNGFRLETGFGSEGNNKSVTIVYIIIFIFITLLIVGAVTTNTHGVIPI